MNERPLDAPQNTSEKQCDHRYTARADPAHAVSSFLQHGSFSPMLLAGSFAKELHEDVAQRRLRGSAGNSMPREHMLSEYDPDRDVQSAQRRIRKYIMVEEVS